MELRYHNLQEFRYLSSEKKDELTYWQASNEVKASINKHRTIKIKNQRSDQGNAEKGNRRKKFKKAIKTQSGLSHIMSIMLKEETKKPSLVSAIPSPFPKVPSKTPPLPPPHVPTPVTKISAADVGRIAAAFPDLSTKVQLNSIPNRR